VRRRTQGYSLMSSSRLLLLPDREDSPVAGHAFERVYAPVFELDACTGHKIFHGAGDQPGYSLTAHRGGLPAR
jgi:hypothetical protein